MTASPAPLTAPARRYRVCLVSFSGYPDQGMTFFYETARSLARLGHEVHAYAVGRPGEPEDAVEDGVHVHRVPQPLTVNWASPARWLRKFSFLRGAGQWLRRGRFDVVHVYCTIGSGVLPLLGGRGSKWVLEHQTGAVSQHLEVLRTLENRLRAWQGRTYDINFTVTDVLGRRLFGSRPFEAVPAGVDLGRFRPGLPRTFRAEHGIPDDHIVFVHAGVVEALRATDVPVRAFIEALAADDRLWLLMPGKGSQLEELRAIAKAAGVAERVWLPGYVPYADVPHVFAAADAGVSYLPPTTYYEGQPPMKLMEYLGAGLPVIASDVSSHRMLVHHEVNGLLAPPGVRTLADAMLRFAREPELRARLTAATTGSVAHLTWDRIAGERIVPVYARLVSGT